MSDSRSSLPTLYLAIFLLALTGLFAKMIPLNAVSIIQLRSIVAAAALVLFIILQKRRLRMAGIRTYAGVYALGGLLGLHWVTFFHSMQISSVAVGMLSLFTFPVITILLEPIFSNDRIQGADILAGFIVVIGLAIMVSQDLTNHQQPVVLGIFWGVLSAILFALRNLLQKYHFDGETSDSLMFHQVVAVGLMLAAFIDYPRICTLNAMSVVNIVLLGIFSTATAHTLLTYSLKHLSAKSVALIGCLQPLIATILAWFVIKEMPALSVIIGGGMILSVAAYESLGV